MAPKPVQSATSTTTASPPSKIAPGSKVKPGAKFAGLPTMGDYSDGGGFGPSGDFMGTIIAAGYQIERKLGKEIRPDQKLGYYLALWLQFKVHDLLDEKEQWDPEPSDWMYETTLKMGPLSSFYSFNEWVLVKGEYVPGPPAGIIVEKGMDPFQILDALDVGFTGKRESMNDPNSTFSLTEWKAGPGDELTGQEANATTRGRWYGKREGAKQINAKSAYATFEHESTPALIDTFPDRLIMVVSAKKSKDGKEHERATFNTVAIAPDNMPYGAEYFVGLSGLFGFKPFSFDQKDGGKGEYKVLYLNTAEKWGDEEPIGEGAEQEEEKPKPTTTTSAKKSAAKPAAPVTAQKAVASKATPPPAEEEEINFEEEEQEEEASAGGEDSALSEFEQAVVDGMCKFLYGQKNYEANRTTHIKEMVQSIFPDMANRKQALAWITTVVQPNRGIDGRVIFDPETNVFSLAVEEIEAHEAGE